MDAIAKQESTLEACAAAMSGQLEQILVSEDEDSLVVSVGTNTYLVDKASNMVFIMTDGETDEEPTEIGTWDAQQSIILFDKDSTQERCIRTEAIQEETNLLIADAEAIAAEEEAALAAAEAEAIAAEEEAALAAAEAEAIAAEEEAALAAAEAEAIAAEEEAALTAAEAEAIAAEEEAALAAAEIKALGVEEEGDTSFPIVRSTFAEAELRIDVTDGQAYTKAVFMEFYGGESIAETKTECVSDIRNMPTYPCIGLAEWNHSPPLLTRSPSPLAQDSTHHSVRLLPFLLTNL
eukprot:SAG31_NODE_4142_length_3537_cov_15.892088_1_plen_292_part_10